MLCAITLISIIETKRLIKVATHIKITYVILSYSVVSVHELYFQCISFKIYVNKVAIFTESRNK